MNEFPERLVDDLCALWAKDGELSACVNNKSFQEFVQSDIFNKGLTEFTSGAYQMLDLSVDAQVNKSMIFAQNGHWIATLGKQLNLTNDIIALPFPMLMCTVTKESWIILEQYKINKAAFNVPVISPTPITYLGKVRLAGDQLFCPTSETSIYKIIEQSDNAIIMRIFGPSFAPYIHHFDCTTQKHLFSSHASPKEVSRAFFADVIRYILESDSLCDMDKEEVSAVKSFIVHRTQPQNPLVHQVWPLIQGLLNIDEAETINILKRISKSDHYLAKKATNTLCGV
ncbi:MAG: hypothetical protein L3J65_05090 [Robiginitomaculum sp.]|nr:hypothetical protein [Robiginitomaculum sp.]